MPQVGVDPRTGRLTGRRTRRTASTARARLVRARSHDRSPTSTTIVVPRAARRGQPRQHVVLSDRSARPGGLRRADRASRSPVSRRPARPTITPLSVDAGRLRARHRFAADARRGHRRPGDRRLERSRPRAQARRRRPELVLPARLLLERQAGRKVPSDLGPREAARRAGARAARLSGARRRRSPRSTRGSAEARRRRSSRRRRSRRTRWKRRSRRCRATRATCRCGCRWRRAGSPATPRRPRCGWSASSAASRRSASLERRLRRDGDADDAGGRDGRHGADQRAAGRRTFRVAITPSQPLAAGDYVLRVGARARPGVDPVARDRAAGDSRGARRRPAPCSSAAAPSTGNRDVPTADLRFRRSEQIRVEIPTASTDPVSDAAARSHRQAAGGPGDGGGARRCGRIALGDGAARARAAGAGRLCDRDRRRRSADDLGVPVVPECYGRSDGSSRSSMSRQL